jgi:hypothetical protein
MMEEKFEQLMRDAAATYRTPPDAPLDDMWTEIERDAFRPQRSWTRVAGSRWAALAATLILGIAIGRVSIKRPSIKSPASIASAIPTDSGMAEPYQLATSKYLGQTAALLIALPTNASAARPDSQFVARAGDLLTTTRLLLDSPAAKDPSMRSLLEDLELVLAQVVHLQNNQNKTELDLIHQALDTRDVIPRLRVAAQDISAN